MDITENANFIEALERIGFTSKQITDLMLCINGRIEIDEFAERYEQEKEKNNENSTDK